MILNSRSPSSHSLDFRLLAGFVAMLFLLGGGSRADLSTLVIIRPVAVLLAAWWGLRIMGRSSGADRWFVRFALATFALALLHLAPLPPALWRALPGHELVARVDEVAKLGDVWRPLTIAPDAAANALWSLFVPLAAGLGMMHLQPAERRSMATVVLAMAGLSLALSLAQAFAPSMSFLWFYRITNSGLPVGLFANRNHNAVFLAAMVPLAAAWAVGAPEGRGRTALRALAAAGAMLAAIVVLVGGSRAGVIGLAAGLGGAALLMPLTLDGVRNTKEAARQRRKFTPRMAGLIAAMVVVPAALLVIGLQLGDTGAVGRLTDSGTGDFRPAIWRTTAGLVPQYLPFGSGLGSFVEAYLAGEPPAQMMEQYINHAHNDVLEIALSLGVPGLVLLAAAVVFVSLMAIASWRAKPVAGSHVRLSRGAGFVLGILIVASAVDYPLRVPSLAATGVIALFWLVLPRWRRS